MELEEVAEAAMVEAETAEAAMAEAVMAEAAMVGIQVVVEEMVGRQVVVVEEMVRRQAEAMAAEQVVDRDTKQLVAVAMVVEVAEAGGEEADI